MSDLTNTGPTTHSKVVFVDLPPPPKKKKKELTQLKLRQTQGKQRRPESLTTAIIYHASCTEKTNFTNAASLEHGAKLGLDDPQEIPHQEDQTQSTSHLAPRADEAAIPGITLSHPSSR